MTDILALAWCGIISFGVIMYVLLGGFDIGIGILSPFFNKSERNVLVSIILPVWDGNQTWLVFGGAALYGAFPLAFSTLLPIFYVPILIMVLALLFRGVAFEFRLKAEKTKWLWEGCFFLGSLVATLVQAIVLGTFVQGFNELTDPTSWTFTQLLNPFNLFVSFALVCGYMLLGSNYIIIKTTKEIQAKAYKISTYFQYIVLACFVIVSLWSPYLDPAIKERWFNPQHMPYLAVFPILTLFFFWLHRRGLQKKQEKVPFGSLIGMFILCYFGFIVSIYPYIVPRKIPYYEAASDHSALLFMLVGACIMMPPLLYYTYHSYKIFRGKVEQIAY